jgi:hypothetical protein
MTDYDESTSSGRSARFVRVFSPFLLLLFGLIFANYMVENRRENANLLGTSVPAAERPPTQDSEATAPAASTPFSTAVASMESASSATPLAFATAVPTLLPERVARLAGPPADSSFPMAAPVQFYWESVAAPVKGEAFALYLVGEETELLVGLFEEPNLGTGYQARFVALESGILVGQYHWEVRLVNQDEDMIVGRSERRFISFFEAG